MLLAMVAALSIAYPTELDAAKAGLKEAAVCSQNHRECGGVIYQTKLGYQYSEIVTQGKPYGVSLEQFYVYKSSKYIVADFHVHCDLPGNHMFSTMFSKSDTIENDGFKINGYMFSFKDDMIRAYVPGYDDEDDIEVDMHNTKTGKKKVVYLSSGHIVGIL